MVLEHVCLTSAQAVLISVLMNTVLAMHVMLKGWELWELSRWQSARLTSFKGYGVGGGWYTMITLLSALWV